MCGCGITLSICVFVTLASLSLRLALLRHEMCLRLCVLFLVLSFNSIAIAIDYLLRYTQFLERKRDKKIYLYLPESKFMFSQFFFYSLISRHIFPVNWKTGVDYDDGDCFGRKRENCIQGEGCVLFVSPAIVYMLLSWRNLTGCRETSGFCFTLFKYQIRWFIITQYD